MTLGDLYNLTAYWLDDLQFGYFTKPQLLAFINNGQRELQKKLVKAGEEYYIREVERNTIANQGNYTLPCQFSKVRKLQIHTGTAPNDSYYTLDPIEMMQEDQFGLYGDPQVYYFKNNELILRPIPQSVIVMNMRFVYAVDLIANESDTPDAPVQFHEFIAMYAARDGFIKDTRGVPSDMLIQKIKDFEENLRQDAEDRQIQKPRMVVETGDSLEGVLF